MSVSLMKQAGDESEGEDSPTEGQEPAEEGAKAFEGIFTAMGIDWDEHNDRMLLLDDLPRFVRLNPRASIGTEDVRAELIREGALPVPWLPLPAEVAFLELSPAYSVASCPLYIAGHVYGMDVASGAAIFALDPQPGEHILDLCCCPGAKLCLIADLMKGRGSLTGVDVSKERLCVCRKLAVKYELGRGPASEDNAESAAGAPLRLVLVEADGRSFSSDGTVDAKQVVFDSKAYDWQGMELRGQCRMNKAARGRERRRLKEIQLEEERRRGRGAAFKGYDRVLVDAECTHDGSLRHMAKVMELAPERLQKGFLNADKLATLTDLQKGLLSNGFAQLRVGGVLVYSTCSLSVEQNEAVVSHFLHTHPTAHLDPIHWAPDSDRQGRHTAAPCREGTLKGTWYFEPRLGTSGLFVCRIRKEAAVERP